MKPVLIVYATRQGYTRKVAVHVATTMLGIGEEVELFDAAELPRSFDATRYAGAILLASLHRGRHEREMIEFARAHRVALERIPTAFLSVSLSEVGAKDQSAPFDRRAKAAEDVKRTLDEFCAQTGLHPSRVWPVAGALMYSHYGAFERLVMRVIAARAGGDTDVSHDHEYTDWKALDRFVGTMAAEIEKTAA
jgi:menaquinone-dependent protoporphyrinogen oxidase